MPQHVGNVLKRLVQIFRFEGEERLAAGFFGQILQNLVTLFVFPRDVGGDGVDDHIGLLRHFEGLVAGAVAGSIKAIADDDHGSTKLVARLVHHQLFFGPEVDRIVKRRAAPRAQAADAGLQRFHIIGQICDQFHVAVKGGDHHQVLTRAQDGVHKTDGGLLLKAEAVGNAVRGINQHRDAQRQIGFRGELADLLSFLVFGDVKVFLAKVGNEAALFVGNGEENVDAGDVHRNGGFRRILPGRLGRSPCFGRGLDSGLLLLGHQSRASQSEARQHGGEGGKSPHPHICAILALPNWRRGQFAQPFLQLRRQGRDDKDWLISRRAVEPKPVRLQEVATGSVRRGSVELVAGHRVSQGRHVSADLVSAPGAEADAQQGEAGKMADGFPVGKRAATGFEARGHSGPGFGIARDGFLDAACAHHIALHQGQIDLLHLPAGELTGQFQMRGVGPGNQQRAAGEAVEPVDDAGAFVAAYAGKRFEAVDQRVGDGAAADTGAGVYGHAGGLIDDDAGGVLIEHGERNIFRLGAQGSERRRVHFDLFRAAQQE